MSQYPNTRDTIIALIDSTFENEDIFKKNNPVIKQRIIASDPEYIKQVTNQIKITLLTSTKTDVSKFLSLYLLKNCLGTENEDFVAEVEQNLVESLVNVIKTPQQQIFGPNPNITISSNFHQLLKEILYCLSFKFGAIPKFSSLTNIQAKLGDKIKPKKFIFFKDLGAETSKTQKNISESVPNKVQADSNDQSKQKGSVLDVKPVQVDKSAPISKTPKSPIEKQLEVAIKEREELIATIMGLENSPDKTIAEIAKSQIDELSAKYEQIFISITDTPGSDSDKIMERCVEENNIIMKINEWLAQFINNKCKAEQLKTRVSEILYDSRKNLESQRSQETPRRQPPQEIPVKKEVAPAEQSKPSQKKESKASVSKSTALETIAENKEETKVADDIKFSTAPVDFSGFGQPVRKMSEDKPKSKQEPWESWSNNEQPKEEKPIEIKPKEEPIKEEKPKVEKKPEPKPELKLPEEKPETKPVEIKVETAQKTKPKREEPPPTFSKKDDGFAANQFRDFDFKGGFDDEESSESQGGFNFDYGKHDTPKDSERQGSADFGANKALAASKMKPNVSSKPPISAKTEQLSEREHTPIEFENPFEKRERRDSKTAKRTESPKRSVEEQQDFADELLRRTQRSEASETQRLKNEKDKVHDELNRIRKDYNDLMMEYEGMKNSNKAINNDFTKVKQELETLKGQYKVVTDNKDQINRENDLYERLRLNLYNERSIHLSNMEALNSEISRLRDRLSDYENRNTTNEDPRITELIRVLDETQSQYDKMHTLFQKVLGDRVLTNEEQERLKTIDFRNQTLVLTERVQDMANQSRSYSPPRNQPTRYSNAEYDPYKGPLRSPKYSSGTKWFNHNDMEARGHASPSPIRMSGPQTSQNSMRSPFSEKYLASGPEFPRSPIRTLVEYKEYKPKPQTIQYVSKTEKTKRTINTLGQLGVIGNGAKTQYYQDNYQELPTFARDVDDRLNNVVTRGREVRQSFEYQQTLPTYEGTQQSFFTQRQLSPIRTVPTDHSVRFNTEVENSTEFRRVMEPSEPIQIFTESHRYENVSKSKKGLSRRESISNLKTVMNEVTPRSESNSNLAFVTIPQVAIENVGNQGSVGTRESTAQLSTASFNKESLTTVQYINALRQVSPTRSSITASFPNGLANSGIQKDNSPPRLSQPSISPMIYNPSGSVKDVSPVRTSIVTTEINNSTPSKPLASSSASSGILDLIDKQLARSRQNAGSASKENSQITVIEPTITKSFVPGTIEHSKTFDYSKPYDFSKSLPTSTSTTSLRKILIGNSSEATNMFNPTVTSNTSYNVSSTFSPNIQAILSQNIPSTMSSNMPTTITSTIPSTSIGTTSINTSRPTPVISISNNNFINTFNPQAEYSTIKQDSPTTTRFPNQDFNSKSPEGAERQPEAYKASNNTLVLGSPVSHGGDSFLSKGDIVQVTRTQYKDPMESLMKTKLDDSVRVREIRNVPQVKFSALSNL